MFGISKLTVPERLHYLEYQPIRQNCSLTLRDDSLHPAPPTGSEQTAVEICTGLKAIKDKHHTVRTIVKSGHFMVYSEIIFFGLNCF